MSGLTPTGFIAKTIQEIVDDIGADIHATIDPALDLSPDQPLGQIIGIVAKKQAEQWELAATLASSFNPDGAENFLLDNISRITGLTRLAATPSEVVLNCTFTSSFAGASAGAMMANVNGQPDVKFTNKSAVANIATLGGPGTYPVVFDCTVVGPVAAPSGTLTVITAPVTGWSSCTNPLDATRGTQDETDADLRIRRAAELTSPGADTVDAIRADLLKVPGVQQCYVFENTSLVVDSTGLPGKAIEVVIFDGAVLPEAADADIAQAVWNGKPSGIETYGTTSHTVKDSTGVNRTVFFSRATPLQVWLSYDVTVDPNFFPDDGVTEIKNAAAAYAATALNLGVDVFAVAFKAAALKVRGVLDVPALRLGFAVVPVGTANLTITGRQIAAVDTSRIDVNVTDGSP